MQQNVDVTVTPGAPEIPGRPADPWGLRHMVGFQRLIQELEDIFGAFQGLTAELDREEPAEAARSQFGALKRAVSERLPEMFGPIRAALVEMEFWQPGVLSRCDEMWLDQPLPIQGSATWLGYLGKLRQLLVDALGCAAPPRRGRGGNGRVLALDPRKDAAVMKEWRKPGTSMGRRGPEFLTPQEVAARYHVDAKTVRRKLRNHPEVRQVSTVTKKGHAPSRQHLRIPVSLADRLWKPGGLGT